MSSSRVKSPTSRRPTRRLEVADPDLNDLVEVLDERPQPRRISRSSGTAQVSKGLLDRLVVKRGRGGIAPFVPPASRARRAQLRRRLQRRGFIPLSPGRPRVRHRILPRTVIGIAFTVLAFAVGIAFSGAAFYAYYDNRLAQNEIAVTRFVEGFDQQYADAAGSLDDLRVESIEDIRAELAPLGEYVSDANGVARLPATAGPSVWLLETMDEAGRFVVGASFAAAPHRGGTAFVTSFALVSASTVSPGPSIELVKGDQRLRAELWAWDIEHDLAVVLVDNVVPALPMATDEQQVSAVGGRVFALSGVGGRGAAASPGVLLDSSNLGLQHTAAVGSFFRGGPLLTGEGTVVGVASLSYQPYGVDQGQVLAAPAISALCSRVLSCVPIGSAVQVAVEEAGAKVEN